MTNVDLRQLAELRSILLTDDMQQAAEVVRQAMQELITWRSVYASQVQVGDLAMPRLTGERLLN